MGCNFGPRPQRGHDDRQDDDSKSRKNREEIVAEEIDHGAEAGNNIVEAINEGLPRIARIRGYLNFAKNNGGLNI